MKTTKTDAAKGRDQSLGMRMGNYADYLQHLLGEQGGPSEALLKYR